MSADYSDTLTVTTDDTIKPQLVSATISASGNQLILVFDEEVTGDATVVLSASGGAVTITNVSGSGTDTLTYTLSRTVESYESVYLTYTR